MISHVHRDFEAFLRFKLSLAELRARLGPAWHFERDGDTFELWGDVTVDTPIGVDFEDVNNAITLALQNKVPSGALEEWANLMLLSDVYEIAPRRDQTQREKLLQCIHYLASPSVFGELDAAHLLELKSICQS